MENKAPDTTEQDNPEVGVEAVGEEGEDRGRPNLATHGSLAVFPVQSDHGDVHDLIVCRTNGDSVTVEEYRRVFTAVTGRELAEDEVDVVREWFAEEDR